MSIQESRMRAVAGGCAVVLTLAALAAPPAATAQQEEVPEALRRLAALEGSWESDRVEFLDEDGEVVRVSSAVAENELRFDGNLLVHNGRLDGPVIRTQGWYYWSPEDEQLHLASVAGSGRYDEFAGGWQGERLVMEMLPSPAFPDRAFRMTQSEIGEDSYLETLEVSTDGGETWRVSSRQRMHRVDGADAAEILEAMDAYVGHWRTEERTDRGGDAFHFEYDMAWLDEGRTIARFRVTRVGSDGSAATVFEGYKGREPDGADVYYHGASPSGRGARGEVVLDDDRVVTRYEGWTAEGAPVRIRDIFEPVRDGSFRSTTLLKPSPEAEWREIGADTWTRVGPPR